MPDLQQQFLQSFLNIQQDSRLRGNDGGWVRLSCGKGFRLPQMERRWLVAKMLNKPAMPTFRRVIFRLPPPKAA